MSHPSDDPIARGRSHLLKYQHWSKSCRGYCEGRSPHISTTYIHIPGTIPLKYNEQETNETAWIEVNGVRQFSAGNRNE